MGVATAEVTNNDTSVRSVATEYGVSHVYSHRFCVRFCKNENPKAGYKPHNIVFDFKKGDVFRDYV
jgi:hypothetical protein